MNPLTTRLTEARNLAADREGDIRIKEFIRAMSIRAEGDARWPVVLEITCHFRSWEKSLTPVEAAQLVSLSDDVLANAVAAWVQGAINQNLLLLSDPPRASDKLTFSVGGILTHIYAKDYTLIGKRWG